MAQLLTHSRMQSFKQCRRRHWWEYEVGIRKVTDAKALRMGSAGHAALEALKNGRSLEHALEVIGKLYAVCPDGFDVLDWEYERVTVATLVTGYQWRWGDLEMLATEREFRIPLVNPATNYPTPNWDLAGKIDGICVLEDGRLAVVEHKFVSDSIDADSDYWKRITIDPQITMYVYAARVLGYEIESVLYDVIRKPTIRPEKVPLVDEDGLKVVVDQSGKRAFTKQGKPRQTADASLGLVMESRPQSPHEWQDKLLADIENRTGLYYHRKEVARLDDDILNMQEEIWDLQQIMRDAQSKDRWYKTVTRDTCTFCPFLDLCVSGRESCPEDIPDGFQKVSSVHPELEAVA